METKMIAALGVVAILVAVAGGAYFYMGGHTGKSSTPGQPQTPPAQQGGQGSGQGGQGGQQGNGQGAGQGQGGQQGGQSSQGTGQGQGGQGSNEGESGNSGEQQGNKAPSFNDLLKKNMWGSALYMEGVINFRFTSDKGASLVNGKVKFARRGNDTAEYINGKYTMKGETFTGEMLTISTFENGINYYIVCMKNAQTNEKWMCFKMPAQQAKEVSQNTGGNPSEGRKTWTQMASKYRYEGLKTIHGVVMHCYYAHYMEEGKNVDERVCFDATTLQFRYWWYQAVKGGEKQEGEFFIEKITFNPPESLFEAPVPPQSFPGYGG